MSATASIDVLRSHDEQLPWTTTNQPLKLNHRFDARIRDLGQRRFDNVVAYRLHWRVVFGSCLSFSKPCDGADRLMDFDRHQFARDAPLEDPFLSLIHI